MQKTETAAEHRAGFVSIIGQPNVGKSTLMNALIGERLSITTHKAQTTRHRIFGIFSGENFQIVYSDTPGVIAPKYELQRSMMRFVHASLEDADVMLLVTDVKETFKQEELLPKFKNLKIPIFMVINKIDMLEAGSSQLAELEAAWKEKVPFTRFFPVSALTGAGVQNLSEALLSSIPVHPPYFPVDEVSDKSERFFASEIIREKIFQLFDEEVPYSCEVVVTSFKEKPDILVIQSEIFVERPTQRAIILGHEGKNIKKLGTESRKSLEAFFGRKVFLETHIRVEPDWRNRKSQLNRFGYEQI